MSKEVKVKDRKEDVEFLRMACNIAEIGIGYTHADLILRLQKRLETLGGKFSLQDGVEILCDWKKYWAQYFDDQTKNKLTEE